MYEELPFSSEPGVVLSCPYSNRGATTGALAALRTLASAW